MEEMALYHIKHTGKTRPNAPTQHGLVRTAVVQVCEINPAVMGVDGALLQVPSKTDKEAQAASKGSTGKKQSKDTDSK